MSTSTAVDERIRIRWSAWFGDRELTLPCPASWDVRLCSPAGVTDIGADGIQAAFDNPIGTPRLRDLAAGKQQACVVVDDLSRPTPTDRLLPPVLDELEAAGIPAEQVTILVAVANHRPMMHQDLEKKIGRDALERCIVRNHFSWHSCVPVGTTPNGTPIEINRHLVDADLRILVGSIVPHPLAGFSGGAKLLLPGSASITSAEAYHRQAPGADDGYGVVDTALRRDSEAAAAQLNIDFLVNSIPTPERGVAALVTGDIVAAHRAGVERARAAFSTAVPAGADICLISAYPKDNEMRQFAAAFAPLRSAPEPLVREGGTVLMTSAGTEGPGFHSLMGPGMPLFGAVPPPVSGADLVVFSPGVRAGDLEPSELARMHLFATWEETLAWLVAKHGESARMTVLPSGVHQLVDRMPAW